MKTRVIRVAVGLVVLGGIMFTTGGAFAQCPTANQVTNSVGTPGVVDVTFLDQANGTGTINIAGTAWTNAGNGNTGLVIAADFASRAAGVVPTATGTGTFVGILTFNTGTASGATVRFTSVAPFTANSASAMIAAISVSGKSVLPSTTIISPGTASGAQNLTTLLLGNTACLGTVGSWQNQELHVGGGNLIDYKQGPAPGPDPSTSVGSWSITGTGASTAVSYTYGATTYTYKVFGIGSPYTFCLQPSNAPTYSVGIKTGGGACP